MYSSTLSLTLELDGMGGQRHETQYPIVQQAGWAPGSIWTCAENFAKTGIPSPDCQHVASRYTDWAIPAPVIITLCKVSRYKI